MVDVPKIPVPDPGYARRRDSAGGMETMIKFAFKSVFWFAVVLALLPGRAPDLQSNPAEQMDSIDRFLTTGTINSRSEIRSLASRLQTVCEQNPDLCVSSLDNMSMVAAMLGYQVMSFGACSEDAHR